MLITSASNAQVKIIRSLRNRKGRDETGLFFVEGAMLTGLALEAGADIETLVVAPELTDDLPNEFNSRLNDARGLPRLEVSKKVFESIAQYGASEGIGAVVRQRWEQLTNVRLAGELCWIAIGSALRPNNLGTLLRISDSVGGKGLILIGDSADPYDISSVRSSLGMIFFQKVVRTSSAEFAKWKRERGYFVVGTSPEGSADYQSVAYKPPLVLLLGSEWTGLSEEEQSICAALVRIPMMGRVESHIVAVAA